MIFNTFLSEAQEIPVLKRCGIQEVILEHFDLSRLGILKTEEFKALCVQAHAEGLSLLLQWDVLCTESQLNVAIDVFETLPLELFDAVRVQDLGVAEWIKDAHHELSIHWIVESNSHNLVALQRWVRYFAATTETEAKDSPLKRLVLSTEIPGELLKHYCENLDVPCEVLGVGQILIFHTPRALLSPCSPHEGLQKLQVSTPESSSRSFPTLENQHGTFLFHHRDLFLLTAIPDFKKTPLHAMRLDLRHIEVTKRIVLIERISKVLKVDEVGDLSEVKGLKNDWPVNTTLAFYRANHTDRSFSKLKNKHRKDHGEDLVAYVAESLKDKHLALISRKAFRCGETLRFLNPEGKEVTTVIRSICTTSGEEVEEALSPGLWLIPHIKRITSQSLVYRSEDTA